MSNDLREVVRDALVLVTGVVLVASTIWLPIAGDTGASGAILVLGMLTAGTALWAMSSASRSSHWAHVVLGSMLAVSPVVLAFPAGLVVTDMFALVSGVIIAVIGVLGVRAGGQTFGAPSRLASASGAAPIPARVRS